MTKKLMNDQKHKMCHLEGNATSAAVFLKPSKIEGNYGVPILPNYTVTCRSFEAKKQADVLLFQLNLLDQKYS